MKLEDIPKKEIFTAPEGYFDTLPGVIQARVAKQTPAIRPVWRYSLRYALPAVVLFAAGILWYTRQASSPQDILEGIATEELMSYLEESEGLSTEELLDTDLLDTDDAQAIEQEVYHLDLDDDVLDAIEDNLNDLNSL
ncbi:hypothetical protein [Dawidia soli]|uniref:Uncharacterized protein n=1 Tax=Dawidia soli TaxID=2782352 RepID=A0AAP2DCA5_9BACT|nr:hypothetical protein [Dawidia soli]MBT1688065.1 hypothetical protein [Dawidia soli]